MLFKSLAKFIKPHLNSARPINNLLPIWMKEQLRSDSSCNVRKIIQAEFKLCELEGSKKFFIIPRSRRAHDLLKLLKEYIQLMESTRFSRWVEKVKPQDFEIKT
ncbi:MAG TPA: hypothetical protein V6C96_02100 [Vampirovibrionales bacterium]